MTNKILLLIVEDEHLLREFLQEGLADAGFDVLARDGGTSALAALDTDASSFNALITDIRLGDGVSGWDIGRRARELVPDIPVVYTSGDSGSDWTAQGVPGSVIIQKPFVIAQLITAVSTLLNKSSV